MLGVVPDPGPSTAPLAFSTPDHMMLAQAASMCCLQSPLRQEFQELHIRYHMLMEEEKNYKKEEKNCQGLGKRTEFTYGICTMKVHHKIHMVYHSEHNAEYLEYQTTMVQDCRKQEKEAYNTYCFTEPQTSFFDHLAFPISKCGNLFPYNCLCKIHPRHLIQYYSVRKIPN